MDQFHVCNFSWCTKSWLNYVIIISSTLGNSGGLSCWSITSMGSWTSLNTWGILTFAFTILQKGTQIKKIQLTSSQRKLNNLKAQYSNTRWECDISTKLILCWEKSEAGNVQNSLPIFAAIYNMYLFKTRTKTYEEPHSSTCQVVFTLWSHIGMCEWAVRSLCWHIGCEDTPWPSLSWHVEWNAAGTGAKRITTRMCFDDAVNRWCTCGSATKT